jgi:hypothetical protein
VQSRGSGRFASDISALAREAKAALERLKMGDK